MIEASRSEAHEGQRLARRRGGSPTAAGRGAGAAGLHWLIVGTPPGGSGQPTGGAFSVAGKLAVFSFREEAEAFLARRVRDDSWRVRGYWAGELISLLYAPWNGFERVALDPPPESAGGELDGLVSVSKQEFVELLARRVHPLCKRLAHTKGTEGIRDTGDRGSKGAMNEEQLNPQIEPPEFSATVRIVESVPVVEVTGELDLATIPQLLDAIGRAGSQLDGRALAVVDLREAQFIDAAGTRKLLEQARAMRGLGGELRLIVHKEGPVARVFELLEVEDAVDVHHDLDLSR